MTTLTSASMEGRLKRIDDMGDEVDCLRMCGVGDGSFFAGEVVVFEVW